MREIWISIAVVISIALLAIYGCIWMAGGCSREEEKNEEIQKRNI